MKKNTIIFNEGDFLERLYFVKKGFVKLYRLSDNGRESTIYLYGPGSVLGVRAFISKDKCACHFAEALTDLEVMTITRSEYLEALAESPEYLVDFLHIFIDRLNHTERKLEGFILTDTTSRIAYFLYDCAIRFCKPNGKKVTLPIILTHQRIAEFIGSVRETVTVAVQRLEKDEILRIKRGKVTILDLKKLHKLALLD